MCIMSRLVDFHKGGVNQMSCAASKEREREDLLAENLMCSSYTLLSPLSTLFVHPSAAEELIVSIVSSADDYGFF